MPITWPGHSDCMSSAVKILLIFKYQTIARMKARNINAGLQAIATAQLDAHLWRRRKKGGERQQRGRAPEGPGSWTLKHSSREQQQ